MPERTIQVKIGDKTLEIPKGTPISAIFDTELERETTELPVVAALLNGVLTPLCYPVDVTCVIEPVTPDTIMGKDVYRRSLSFLLTVAVAKVFPDRGLVMSHSLGHCYFYYFEGIFNITKEECDTILKCMGQLIEKDIPIIQRWVRSKEAEEFFRANNMLQSVAYLENHVSPTIRVNQCDDQMDIAFYPLVHRTGLLKHTDLLPYESGMILLYPSAKNPMQVPKFTPAPHLYRVYDEYRMSRSKSGVSCVGELNSLVRANEVSKFILTCEALHERKMGELCEKMGLCNKLVYEPGRSDADHPEHFGQKVVMIAGPSSSGKTTFAHRLQNRLRSLGVDACLISTDNYFVNREETPLGPDGKPDFECIGALQLERFNDDMIRLTSGEAVRLPLFDFKSGKSLPEGGPEIKLTKNSVLICEGIHSLNPLLNKGVPQDMLFNVYIAPFTQMSLNDHWGISTTDMRLIRRIVRDMRTRGWSPSQTIRGWDGVRRGEAEWIQPYSSRAHFLFNSALDYEPAVIAPYLTRCLRHVEHSDPAYAKSRELLRFVEHFIPIDQDFVPPNSLLREFIGGSSIKI